MDNSTHSYIHTYIHAFIHPYMTLFYLEFTE